MLKFHICSKQTSFTSPRCTLVSTQNFSSMSVFDPSYAFDAPRSHSKYFVYLSSYSYTNSYYVTQVTV